MRASEEEILALLADFERNLRYLADARQHMRYGGPEGKIVSGECGGTGTCIKCRMLAKADRIADITSSPDNGRISVRSKADQSIRDEDLI